MSLFLGRDEIAEITGRKQKGKQIEQLHKMRIPFEVNALGNPVVLKGYVETLFGGVNKKRRVNSARADFNKRLNAGEL